MMVTGNLNLRGRELECDRKGTDGCLRADVKSQSTQSYHHHKREKVNIYVSMYANNANANE